MKNSEKDSLTMCTKCTGKTCFPIIKIDSPLPPLDEAPSFCPMRCYPDIMKNSEAEYEKQDIREFARLASIQEAECYEFTPDGIRTKIPRLEETIQFAQKCNYDKLGLAFCDGLRHEAGQIVAIFEAKGFDVVSICCKVGRVQKETLGLTGEQKILGSEIRESMCNPIAQAEILNAEKVDLGIMMGLCIGHDTLFLKYARVPITVLAVKDRVLGHNPLAAVYLSNGPYYGRMKGKSDKTGKGKKVTIPG